MYFALQRSNEINYCTRIASIISAFAHAVSDKHAWSVMRDGTQKLNWKGYTTYFAWFFLSVVFAILCNWKWVLGYIKAWDIANMLIVGNILKRVFFLHSSHIGIPTKRPTTMYGGTQTRNIRNDYYFGQSLQLAKIRKLPLILGLVCNHSFLL